MNYDEFLKSKQIAERWGEAQATFKAEASSAEGAYYQGLLTEFYDYIKLLESHFFVSPASPSQSGTPTVAPTVTKEKNQPEHLLTQIPSAFSLENQPAFADPQVASFVPESLTDEEDPWFGFPE